MSKLEQIFSDEQLRFIARKAISKYNLAVVEGKLIRVLDATEYKLLGLEKDKPYFERYPQKDFSDKKVVIVNQANNNYQGIAQQIDKNWNDIKVNFNDLSKLNIDIEKTLKTYHRFLRFGKKELDKDLVRSEEIAVAVLCYILKEQITSSKRIKEISDRTTLLESLKILLEETFKEFPKDVQLEDNAIKIAKYNIIVIGDSSSESRYNDIVAELKKSDSNNNIEAHHWNTSDVKSLGEFFLEKFSSNKDEKLIGVLIYLTNEVSKKVVKRGKEPDKKLIHIILEWSRIDENRIVPITYVKVGKLKKEYLEKFKELGEPSEDNLGILSLFIKAIQRYKEKDEEYKLILDESIELKETIDSQTKEMSSLNSGILKSSNERDEMKRHRDKMKHHRNTLLLITLPLLIIGGFFTFKYHSSNYPSLKGEYKTLESKYDSLENKYVLLTKDDVIPFRTISHPNKNIEPFYVKLSPSEDYLFISNKAKERRGEEQDFFRVKVEDIESHKEPNLKLEYGTMTYVLHEPSNGFGFLSEDSLIVSTNYQNSIKIVKLDTVLSQSSVLEDDYTFEQGGASLDEIAVWSSQLFVVTTWQSDNIIVFQRTNSNPKFDTIVISVVKENEKGLCSPSGVSFLNENLVLVCLNSENEQKDKLVIIDIKNQKLIKKNLLNSRALNDIDIVEKNINNRYALTCSDWESTVYQLDISKNKLDISNQKKGLNIEELHIRDGSPTDICYRPDGKYAIVAHQNHKRFDLLYTEELKPKIEKTYKFHQSVPDLYKCEGLEVDWCRGTVFIPNLKSGKVYCFKLEEEYKYCPSLSK